LAASKQVLRVKGLPRALLSGSEVLVIELVFDHPLTEAKAPAAEFKG
jgi:hypothetical protein